MVTTITEGKQSDQQLTGIPAGRNRSRLWTGMIKQSRSNVDNDIGSFRVPTTRLLPLPLKLTAFAVFATGVYAQIQHRCSFAITWKILRERKLDTNQMKYLLLKWLANRKSVDGKWKYIVMASNDKRLRPSLESTVFDSRWQANWLWTIKWERTLNYINPWKT